MKVASIILLFFIAITVVSSTTRVLVIGVGEYEDPRVVKLPGALKDAKLFKDTVISLGLTSEQNVIILENPIRSRILSEIRRFLLTSEMQDRLILYYAGHGYVKDGKMYLIPKDVDSSYIEDTSYNFTDELPKLFAQAKAQDIVMIIDACYSGSIIVDRPLVGARVEKANLEELAKSRGVVFLLSSGPEERSQEKPEGGGWFTHYLLEGLKGEAGKGKEYITVKDIYEYVREMVSKQTLGRQNPMLVGERDVALVRNIKLMYQSLAMEIMKLSLDGKIDKDLAQLYMKILLQTEDQDSEFEKQIRKHLFVYANDKNLDLLIANTKLSLIEEKKEVSKPEPTRQQPTSAEPLKVEKGHCVLKVIAGNDLAREGTVYVDGKERGKLREGVLEVLDLSVGKHVLVVDGEKIDRFEKEIEFANDYEVQEAKVIVEAAKRFVRVVTEPAGARVWIDGKEVGTSTWQGRLEVGKIYEIKVMKEGYAEEVRKINVPGKGELIEIKISMQLKPNSPPAKPSSASPVDGVVNVSITPVLSWVCSDPDGDALSYDIYFGTNPSPPLVKSNHTSMTYNPGTLSYSTTYYWRVVAKDSKGGATYGDVWRFTTIPKPNNPPEKPSDPYPANGASGVTTSPILSWKCSDPDGDSLVYDIYFGTDPIPPLVKSNHSTTVYGPGALNQGTTYYWRVVAKDSKGGTTYGDVWRFTTMFRQSNIGTLKWRYLTSDWVSSSPAIGIDGTIYVGSRNGYIYAVNPNGTLKWRYQTGGRVISSPAIGTDGTIYVGSLDGYIYALNPNGTLKWKFQTGGEVYSSPAIGTDGTIYVGSLDGYIYALNPSGTLKWRYQTGGIEYSSPAIGADGTIYVGSQDYYIYALNPNGTLRWRYRTGYDVDSSPVIGADGTIYVGSWDRYIYALNPNGTVKWRYQTNGGISSCPAIGSDGTIYVGSRDGYIYALNANGTLKWKYNFGSYVDASPVVGANGTIYVGGSNGRIYALNPNGTLRWEYQTGGAVYSSATIAADGTIYVGSSDGYLYAIYGDSQGLANSSWPKFRGNSRNTGRFGDR